jgi:hypothetical protein
MRSRMIPIALLATLGVACTSNNSTDYQPFQAQPYGTDDAHATLAALEPMDQDPYGSSSAPAPRTETRQPPNWQPGKMRYDAVIPVERVAHLEPSLTSEPEQDTYQPAPSYDESLAPRSDSSYSATGQTHQVRKGDTLYSLARQYYNDQARWRDIFNANRAKLGNPNSLPLGTRLVIP